MSIPKEHLQQLKDGLDQLKALDHLQELLSNENLLEALSTIRDDANAREEALKDFRVYLEKHHVKVPQNVTVNSFARGVPICVELGVTIYFGGVGTFYGVHYDTEKGWGLGGCKA